MKVSILTICGIDELPAHSMRAVTHVLSVLDPGWPEIAAFRSFGAHRRTTLHFNDILEPEEHRILPGPQHMTEILRFGADLSAADGNGAEAHLLVHCHAGVSRSTAAMLCLLARESPGETEDALFERLRRIRPQAWPNSLMVSIGDKMLGRGGRLVDALRRHYGHQIRRDPGVADEMTGLGRRREVEMAI
jgi:predicted protein tyrosine phosphatase